VEFQVISINARFLLFNETAFPLKATAFAVRPPDDGKQITMPPFGSPAVQAATLVAEPKNDVPEEAREASQKETADKKVPVPDEAGSSKTYQEKMPEKSEKRYRMYASFSEKPS